MSDNFFFTQKLSVGLKKPFVYTHYIGTRANTNVHLISGMLVTGSQTMSCALEGTHISALGIFYI